MARRWRIGLSRGTDSFLLSVISFLLKIQMQNIQEIKPRKSAVKPLTFDSFYRQDRYPLAQSCKCARDNFCGAQTKPPDQARSGTWCDGDRAAPISRVDIDYRNIQASAVDPGRLAYAHGHRANSSGYAAVRFPIRSLFEALGKSKFLEVRCGPP